MSFVTTAYLVRKLHCPRYKKQIAICTERMTIEKWMATKKYDGTAYPPRCKYDDLNGRCTYKKRS